MGRRSSGSKVMSSVAIGPYLTEPDTTEVERLKALLREMMEDYLVLVRDGPWPVMSQGHADSGNLVKRVREALSEG